MIQIVCGALHNRHFSERYSEQMYRLRYEVFHQRLGWDVTVDNGQEKDPFDDLDSVYMVATDDADRVCGGWRLRPTTRPYMLSDIFSQLLNGHPAPRHRHIWEISRFAVDTSKTSRTAAFSMGQTARQLVRDTVRFAVDNHIGQYVLVTSVAVERLLAGTGLILHRFGPPVKIGRVGSVACWVDIDAHTRHVALGETPCLAEAA
ncbi:MAG: acyl-homoserine-lactone synthase [Panacagrimonas sp.]